MTIHILSGGAFSHTQVAKDIIRVLSDLGEDVRGHFGYYRPQEVRGPTILVGGLGPPEFNNIRWIRKLGSPNPLILYVACEGPLRPGWVRLIYPYIRDAIIIAPTEYVRDKLRASGLDVAGVIPHGVRAFGLNPKYYNNKVFGYVGGYLKRKYPEYGIRALELAKLKPLAITTPDNPYRDRFIVVRDDEYKGCPDEAIQAFYRSLNFYLNLSDAEGFGLTVLEAMAFGCIPILPKLPVFNYLPEYGPIWVPITGDKWLEPWGGWLYIEHYRYRPEDMAEAIAKAKAMAHTDYMQLSRMLWRYAHSFDIRLVYPDFLTYL